MTIFKRNQSTNEESMNIAQEKEPHSTTTNEHTKVKKKVKIGFRHKKELPTPNSKAEVETPVKEEVTTEKEIQNNNEEKIQIQREKEQINPFIEEINEPYQNDKEELSKGEKKEEERPPTKRKAFLQKDMKGKSVFLEDTGEKLGVVFDEVLDGEKNLIGYKIKDSKSDSILSFPLDQFDEDKSGLIFVPSWYTKGLKTIEQLEFKDRITPELMWLITDNTISIEELYNIFIKHDDKIASYIQEAAALKEIL